MLKTILFCCFCFSGSTLIGQSPFTLTIHLENQPADFFKQHQLEIQQTHSDSFALRQYLDTFLNNLHQLSYLEASLDTLVFKDSTASASIHIGTAYQKLSISNGNIPMEVLQQLQQTTFFSKKKAIAWSDQQILQENLLVYAENNGYPFAEIWLEDFVLQDSSFSGRLFWTLNKKITFDKIYVEGKSKISPAYLANFLGIHSGDFYSKAKVLAIQQQIKNLPYLKIQEAPKVRFKDNKASVYLFLEDNNTSRFDLLIGVLPDNRLGVGQRSVVLTANGTIDLLNSFGRGERISLEFQQIRAQTQELNSHFSYPYLWNTPFGLSIDFDLFKNDSTNLLLEYEVGLSYLFGSNQYLKFLLQNRTNRLLTIDESFLIEQRTLPANLDTRQIIGGLEYGYSQLDSRLNPRKGWASLVRLGAGEKRVLKNNSIVNLEDPTDPLFSFQSLYDIHQEASFQYQLEGSIQYILPVFQRSAIYLESQNGFLFNQEAVFENEFFRIGGNQILRGFDEESILAKQYSVNTIEYRWLFTKNSNLYAFVDGAYVEREVNNRTVVQQFIGLGIGLQMETTVGMFGISAALGQDLRNQEDFFDFSAPKIHFGFVNLF